MIFAEMEYQEEYWEFHSKLNEHLSAHFHHLKSGIQGDSWFWVYDGEQKVAIDTFSSMKHQVKASVASPLVESVIKTLELKFRVKVFLEPELEAHEDV